MVYLKQITIIFAISLGAELLRYLLPLPVPASIYGLVLLFLLLLSGRLKPEHIKESAEFLTEIMPVMFIPAAVGLIASWEQIKTILLPAAVIIVLTAVIVMGVTGRIAQHMIRAKEAKDE